MIRAAAPGKVVLWGEYAVLQGAPALVMAVDRYAVCAIAKGNRDWRFVPRGHPDPEARVARERLLSAEAPGDDEIWALAWHTLHAHHPAGLPADAEVSLDTAGFYHPHAGKLGLGSSAALCVAAYAAFGRLLDQPVSFDAALAVHRRFQRGHGSGIDVAAAWHGGLLRFQRGAARDTATAEPCTLPAGLAIRFVFTGQSASTRRHLERLAQWLSAGGGAELDALGEASAELFGSADSFRALAHYVAVLRRLDDAARLGIFSEPHRRLGQLAMDAGVVYKPCGAGGGDIGAAFAPDAVTADRFSRLAADHGFLPLALEIASHGIEVTG